MDPRAAHPLTVKPHPDHRAAYHCACCPEGEDHINSHAAPVVVYLAVGVPAERRGELVDFTGLPQFVKWLHEQKIPRRTWCARCFGEEVKKMVAAGWFDAVEPVPPSTSDDKPSRA